MIGATPPMPMRIRLPRPFVPAAAALLAAACGGPRVPAPQRPPMPPPTTISTGSDAGPEGVPADAGAAPGDGSAPDVAPASDGIARRSAGCGRAATGSGRYVRRSITVAGVEREYFLWVPATYRPERAYPLIFRWHGTGGNGLSGGLEVEAHAGDDAIIVSPTGVDGRWVAEPGSPDVALFERLLAEVSQTLCLDPGRVFSYGFSAGARLTNLLACIRGTLLRGIASVAGPPAGDACASPVAAWLVHGMADPVVPIAAGAAARDRYLTIDGCSPRAVPASPAPCVAYEGCATGYPVVWCARPGGHDPMGSFTAGGAWRFFAALP
jgi:polyhydroxybutyrate depolymerase